MLGVSEGAKGDGVSHYFANVRPEVCDLASGAGLRVLDVGCGSGMVGAELRRRGVARLVHGIEVDSVAAEAAAERLDAVWVGDLEDFDLSTTQPPYDLVIAADVLEHLRDPWIMLHRITELVGSGGILVASVPNIRHIRVVFDLAIRGRFDYRDEGVLDRTHLRFFTRRSIVALFEGSGLEIERLIRRVPPERSGWKRAIAALGGDFANTQFLIRARRSLRRAGG